MTTLAQLLSQLSLSCYPSYTNPVISGSTEGQFVSNGETNLVSSEDRGIVGGGGTGVGGGGGGGTGVGVGVGVGMGVGGGVGGGGGGVSLDTSSAVSLMRHITASTSTR